jgi:hypothetical protein
VLRRNWETANGIKFRRHFSVHYFVPPTLGALFRD